MGDQLLIIGATGTAKPGLLAQITALLLAAGLQVRHASRRYQGETEFATGGPLDLAAELGGASVPPEQATLEALKANLDAFHAEFREFVGYEQEDDKKRPAKRASKAKKAAEEPKPQEPKPQEPKPEEPKPEEPKPEEPKPEEPKPEEVETEQETDKPDSETTEDPTSQE